jgi:UPF0716 family protein affecting phage T7 exclusion
VAIVGILFACPGALLLSWAFGGFGAGRSVGTSPGGGTSPAGDVISIITAVAGLVSAVGGLISSIVALIALRRHRSDVAVEAGGSAAADTKSPRLWTPKDGPISDEPNQRQQRR